MGSNEYDNEKPVHDLYLEAYQIAKYPVTNGQYAQFVQATNHAPPESLAGQVTAEETGQPSGYQRFLA